MADTNYRASVGISNSIEFDIVPSVLSNIFECEFTVDHDYDEVPAYSASIGCYNIVLFGIPVNPNPEEGDVDHYYLELSTSMPINIESTSVNLIEMFLRVPLNLRAASTGFTDISKYLLSFVKGNSNLNCSLG